MRTTTRRITFAATVVVATALALPVLAASSSGAPARRGVRADAAQDDLVHLNQIQVVGSHNSYHEMPSAKEQAIRQAAVGSIVQQIQYVHAPLPHQFQSEKVRQIELDTWLDPHGGLFSNPYLRKVAGLGSWQTGIMDKPGIKVLHIQDVDYRSNCLTLKICLTQIRDWSHAHPSHVPIAILIELEDDPLPIPGVPAAVPVKWTSAGLDTLDAEIRSVLSPADLITPDDVRGSHATLDEAVTSDGWPTLAESRGKELFLMDNSGGYRTSYLAGGHDALQGRVIFTNSSPGQPDAAFVEHNDAKDVSVIGDLVKKGYVVRTRADGDTIEARKDDTSSRDAAFASGAQWVSTDYPVPNLEVGFTSPYYASLPGGTVARCNPVNAPVGCVSADLDTIYTPAPVPPTTVPPATPSTTAPATTAPATEPGDADGATPVPGRSTFTG